MSYYSIADLTADAGDVQFQFSFPYLSRDHIHCYVDGTERTDFSFISEYVIALDTPLPALPVADPPLHYSVQIRRATPIDEPAVDFTNITETALDTATLQLLYGEQECVDTFDVAEIEATLRSLKSAKVLCLTHAEECSDFVDEATTIVSDFNSTVAAQVAAVAGYAAAALDSETQAAEYRDLASGYQGLAMTSQTAAAASATAAASSASAAATSASTATTQASTATTQAGLAAAAKTACDSDKTACDADKVACDADVTASAASAAAAAASASSIATDYTAYSSNNSLASNDRVVGLSGASFVFTLTTAVGHKGRIVDILHLGTSLTQVYTIGTTSSQTIAGCDGTATTYLLYTNGEKVTVISDGANWLVLSHIAQTVWVDAGVMTITGTTSNPTKPTTPDYDKVFWRRDGKDCLVKWELQISSSAGAADGSGAYLFLIPASIAIDAIISPVGTAYATATMSEGMRAGIFSHGRLSQDSVSSDNVIAFAYDTTHLQWARDTTGTPLGSAAYAMTTKMRWATIWKRDFQQRTGERRRREEPRGMA